MPFPRGTAPLVPQLFLTFECNEPQGHRRPFSLWFPGPWCHLCTSCLHIRPPEVSLFQRWDVWLSSRALPARLRICLVASRPSLSSSLNYVASHLSLGEHVCVACVNKCVRPFRRMQKRMTCVLWLAEWNVCCVGISTITGQQVPESVTGLLSVSSSLSVTSRAPAGKAAERAYGEVNTAVQKGVATVLSVLSFDMLQGPARIWSPCKTFALRFRWSAEQMLGHKRMFSLIAKSLYIPQAYLFGS